MNFYYKLSEQEHETLDKSLRFLSSINSIFTEHKNSFYISDESIAQIEEEGGPDILAFIIGENFTPEGAEEKTLKDDFLDERKDLPFSLYKVQKDKNTDGFDAYEKMFGIINASGGLGASIDNEMVPAYKELTVIRMMLKDGAFEMALRYWVTDISSLGLLGQETSNQCVAIIEALCIKYGAEQQTVDAIKSIPKGSL